MTRQTTATPKTTSHPKLRSWLITVGWALGTSTGFALLAPPPQFYSREAQDDDVDRSRLGETAGTEAGATPSNIA